MPLTGYHALKITQKLIKIYQLQNTKYIYLTSVGNTSPMAMGIMWSLLRYMATG